MGHPAASGQGQRSFREGARGYGIEPPQRGKGSLERQTPDAQGLGVQQFHGCLWTQNQPGDPTDFLSTENRSRRNKVKVEGGMLDDKKGLQSANTKQGNLKGVTVFGD